MEKRLKRKAKIRSKITSGTSQIPRLSVFRSNKYLYAQLIDDQKGFTMASAKGNNPKLIGQEIAKKAISKKIKLVIFDRNGYKYHGKIKALADTLRENKLLK